MLKNLLGREPALWVAVVTAALGALTAFGVDVSPTVQAVIVAAVSAGLGLIVAITVHDGVAAAVLGFAQALVSLVVGLGYDLSPDNQYKIMALVIAAVAWVTRKVSTAPVPATVSPAGTLVTTKGADGVRSVQ
jgi:hypothetical protein